MEYSSDQSIKRGMSANTLKSIAILAMLIDHIAWAFVPTGSILGQIMHIIGRITMPIMCYFIAEGYHYTRSIRKYILRLGLFAIISHFPFILFQKGKLLSSFGDIFQLRFPTSVIYTLLLGLISLIIWNNQRIKKYAKVIIVILICVISALGDWSFFAVLWVLVFGANYGDSKKQMRSFSIVSAIIILMIILKFFHIINGNWWEQFFKLGVFLAIPLLTQYNGKLGGNKNSKWIFYIFYPLHLFIIGIIKFFG